MTFRTKSKPARQRAAIDFAYALIDANVKRLELGALADRIVRAALAEPFDVEAVKTTVALYREREKLV